MYKAEKHWFANCFMLSSFVWCLNSLIIASALQLQRIITLEWKNFEVNNRTTFVFQSTLHPFECCSCFLNTYRFYNESVWSRISTFSYNIPWCLCMILNIWFQIWMTSDALGCTICPLCCMMKVMIKDNACFFISIFLLCVKSVCI